MKSIIDYERDIMKKNNYNYDRGDRMYTTFERENNRIVIEIKQPLQDIKYKSSFYYIALQYTQIL